MYLHKITIKNCKKRKKQKEQKVKFESIRRGEKNLISHNLLHFMFSRHVTITTPPNKNRFASRVYLGPRHTVASPRRRNGRTMADIRGIAIKRVWTLLNNELTIPRLRVSGRDTGLFLLLYNGFATPLLEGRNYP